MNESGESKPKDQEEKPRRMSVAGWASSAVESVTNRGSKNTKSKDKDSFANLDNDLNGAGADDDGSSQKSRNSFSLTRRLSKKSKDSTSAAASPRLPAKIMKPQSLQGRKTVKALADFNGSADELSFTAGTEITVLNEVVEGWWMGEIDGKKGLFPSSYVTPGAPPSPKHLSRPYKAENDGVVGGAQYATGMQLRVDDQDTDNGYGTSDLDEEYGHTPLTHNKSPLYSGFAAVHSDQPDDTDTEFTTNDTVPAPPRMFADDLDVFGDNQHQQKDTKTTTPKKGGRGVQDSANIPLLSRAMSEGPPSPTVPTTSSSAKKVPPPPPPRRPTFTSQTSTPAIPERRLGPAPSLGGNSYFSQIAGTNGKPAVPPRPTGKSSNSSNDSMQGLHAGRDDGLDYDISPFDSAAELSRR